MTEALIIAATSDIGRAIAHALARRRYDLVLTARDAEGAAREARDIEVRFGVQVQTQVLDVTKPASREALLTRPDLPEVTVCVVGLLGDQASGEADPELAEQVLTSNFNGPSHLLAAVANIYQAAGRGTIVGVSSVAGDRGRGSNYLYGAAKAGFSAYLSGLRNRLARHGVHVVTVKPGFVRTRMTAGMKLPPALTAQPDEVGEAVAKAIERRRNVVYVRPIWRLIMLVIRLVPEEIFKRLSL